MSEKPTRDEIERAWESYKDGNRAPWVERWLSVGYAALRAEVERLKAEAVKQVRLSFEENERMAQEAAAPLREALRVKDEGIQKFHAEECGCLAWRATPECMKLYKLLAIGPAPAPQKPEGERCWCGGQGCAPASPKQDAAGKPCPNTSGEFKACPHCGFTDHHGPCFKPAAKEDRNG